MLKKQKAMRPSAALSLKLLIIVFIILRAGLCEGQESLIFQKEELFQVRTDLMLKFSGLALSNNWKNFPPEKFPVTSELFSEATGLLKTGNAMKPSSSYRLKIYLSTPFNDQICIDVRRPANEKTMEVISAYPSMLLNFKYLDIIESIGKTFEPQLNLGIEF